MRHLWTSEINVGLGLDTVNDMGAALKLYVGESPDQAPAIAAPMATAGTLQPTEGLTFAEAARQYWESKGLRPRSIAEIRTTVTKLEKWRIVHRSCTPMHDHKQTAGQSAGYAAGQLVEHITRDDWAAFLAWVWAEAQAAGSDNPGRVANKAREHVRAVLTHLQATDRLAAPPKLPPTREQRTAAGLFFFTDPELELLYWATYRLPKPKFWREVLPVGAYWRAALAVLVTYGVDTQLLWKVDAAAEPLKWRHVHPPGLSPDRQLRNTCPYGWLAWARKKTGHRFVAPLTAVVAAHLDKLRPRTADSEAHVFGSSGTARPCQLFRRLVELAGIKPKADPFTGQVVTWTLKDLRKTCATRQDETTPGSASAVLGHAGGDGLADVTRTHYRNEAPLLFKAVSATVYPRAFLSILDPSIKPPPPQLLAH